MVAAPASPSTYPERHVTAAAAGTQPASFFAAYKSQVDAQHSVHGHEHGQQMAHSAPGGYAVRLGQALAVADADRRAVLSDLHKAQGQVVRLEAEVEHLRK